MILLLLLALFGAPAAEPFAWDVYGQVLALRVDDQGLVDYRALKAEREPLDRAIASLAPADAGYDTSWSEADRLALHMALVCAARSCPPLRGEPYRGSALAEQLADQTARFLASPSRFRIDRKAGRVYLSKIFDWFGDDFKATWSDGPAAKAYGTKERAVLNFLTPHVATGDREYILSERRHIEFLDYDWSLNEQP